MRFTRTLLIALALLAPALVPTGAMASGADVVDDCADDGVIDGRYSDEELRDGANEVPSDIDEYTDCREVIRAELGSRGGDRSGRGSGGPGDPALTTDSGAVAGSREDIDALNELTDRGGRGRGDAPSIDIGGRDVSPEAGGKVLGLANSSNELPLSMLSALVLLALMAIAGTVLLVRRRGLPEPVAARVPEFLRRVKLPDFFRR
jgi:hypothetical protein